MEGREIMGFFSTQGDKSKEIIRNKVKRVSGFSPQKQWWSVEGDIWTGIPFSCVMIDDSTKKIVLTGKKEGILSKKETQEIMDRIVVEIQLEQPSISITSDEIMKRYEDTKHFLRIYDYKDILRSEVVEDGDSITYTNRKSQAASTAIGYALAGGVGAIIGGLSGSKRNINFATNVSLRIVVRDTEHPLFQIAFLNKKTEKKSNDYKKAIEKANELHAHISVIIDQASKEEELETKHAPAASFSIADELQKVASLLEKGILSKDEYEALKAKILSKA